LLFGCHPRRGSASAFAFALALAVAFAFAFLVVIPEGDLRLFLPLLVLPLAFPCGCVFLLSS
jgi:hypothetical protein